MSEFVFAGLDYHQDSVQVCVLNQDGEKLLNRSVSNQAQQIHQVLTRFGTPQRIGIEACCGAANLAEELVTRFNLPVKLAHPGYVNRMKRSPDKTDFGDAQMLADLSRVNYLPQVWLAPSNLRELRRLIRHRGQLVKRRKETKLRIRGLLRENRIKCGEGFSPWSKPWMVWLVEHSPLSSSDRWVLQDHLLELNSLEARIKSTETQITEETKDDPIVVELLKLKGVGLVTAVTLRAEIGRADRFGSGKQLSRFCGVTPRNASSGARQADAGLIRAGNPDLRTLLIELAHRLIRTDESWMKLAHSLLKQGKHKNIVVAAVANRWVRRLFHLWRSNFDQNSDFLRDGRAKESPAPQVQSTNKNSLKKSPQA